MQYVVHNPRIGLFIDTQNLYHSARDLLERTVNFETLLNVAREGRELVHAIAYTVEKEGES
ncbi:MAG: NYN domain-containing protein, partial [Deinococcus sp.]